MVVFATLAGLWVAGRIGFLSAVVMASDCLTIEPLLLGQGGHIDAVLDTLALAGVAALGLIVTTGLVGWHEKTLTWRGAALGAVNTGMAVLLIAQWVVGWSFFNPDSWQAKVVMPFGPEIRSLRIQSSWPQPRFESAPGWRTVGPNAYFNAELGIYARQEPIRPCFSAAFVRQNMLNANRTGLLSNGVPIASIPDNELDRTNYAFIYYDRNNQYLTSENYPHHDAYIDLQRRDAERDASGRWVDPAEIAERVEASVEWLPGSAAAERPYTLDEINAMVRETWDRDAPLP